MRLVRIGKQIVDLDQVLCIVDGSGGGEFWRNGHNATGASGSLLSPQELKGLVRIILRDGAGEVRIQGTDITEARRFIQSLGDEAAVSGT